MDTTATTPLHIAMLPWLAMGHLLPFLELSKRLARHGHRISFLTTPANVRRLLPKIPPSLSTLLHLVELRMPVVDRLPTSVENTIDLPSDDLRPLLTVAYNALQDQVSDFLQHARPDWVIHDYAAGWAQGVAAGYGVPCTFLCLFNAASMAFFGGPKRKHVSLEDFTKVPEWIPFPTTIAYRPFEARELFKHVTDSSSKPGESPTGLKTSSFLAIRSCREFEGDWIDLVSQFSGKPIVPVGLLPPLQSEVGREEGGCESWPATLDWLDKQESRTVVYVAFGSEAKLKGEQIREVAGGLELSRLPFVWVLRGGPLPEGFEDRTAGCGVVCTDWIPQDRVLGHPAVGGFLTHGGWNSIVEGLSFGLAMVILPLVFDQGLNARNLVDRGIGVEMPRDDDDGAFTRDGVAESLRLAMVGAEGEGLRAKARECKEIFGDEELQDRCVGQFVEYFLEHRLPQSSNVV